MPNEHRIGRLKGRYVVSWWVDGKRKRYRLDSLTRKEAEAEAVDVIRREAVKPKTTTVADLWEAYRTEKDGRRGHGLTITIPRKRESIGPLPSPYPTSTAHGR